MPNPECEKCGRLHRVSGQTTKMFKDFYDCTKLQKVALTLTTKMEVAQRVSLLEMVNCERQPMQD